MTNPVVPTLLASALAVGLGAQEAVHPISIGSLEDWTVSGTAAVESDPASPGQMVLRLGPGNGRVERRVAVEPGATYRLTASLRCSSGAGEIRLGVEDHGGPPRFTASPLVSWRQVALDFTTAAGVRQATILVHAPIGGWVRDIGLIRLAEMAPGPVTAAGIPQPTSRALRTELGITQLSDAQMAWYLDAKFGLFLHWGLYAGPGRGEWMMYAENVPAERYRTLADPASGDEYFAADRYDPAAWARIAKDAGMQWVCLTTRHHDGFNLFDVPHPAAFTSMQTHQRDFVKEYVDAVRSVGLRVGLYFSPLNWRHPGVFDVTGTDCKPNNFGFTTDPTHHEDARVMKEENYAAVRQLMTAYGPIDHIFWDGGWLAHQDHDADAAFFHEPGLHRDPANAWPVGAEWSMTDPTDGTPYGIMGLVRHCQPTAITNYRYGWTGDISNEEGGHPVNGPMRVLPAEKCLSMHGSWGYNGGAIEHGHVMSRDEIIRMLADCVVRNMTLLLNVGPDRHGVIHPKLVTRLHEVGAWLAVNGEGIYGTRSGPWQPMDDHHGYCHRGDTLYIHLLAGHQGDTFRIPPVGPLVVQEAYAVMGHRRLTVAREADGGLLVSGIDRSLSPVDTIIAVRFDRPVVAVP